METITSAYKSIEICIDTKSFGISLRHNDELWQADKNLVPELRTATEVIPFASAAQQTHEHLTTGVGQGIRSHFSGFSIGGRASALEFETWIWIEFATEEVYFEFIPLAEAEEREVDEQSTPIIKIIFPGAFVFDEMSDRAVSLLPIQQGTMIPNTWGVDLGHIPFEGRFLTAGAYMPWFGQIKSSGEGYIAIGVTPWNSGYDVEHKAAQPTRLATWHEMSLGKMAYRRVMKFIFTSDADHNTLAKLYRSYVDEEGTGKTLAQKALELPAIHDLIGSMFVHTGIKTYVQENSSFYDPSSPEKNNHLRSFKQREDEIRAIHAKGVKKLYMHLDGWAEPGYDNNHPDYMPACEAAGGWDGLKSLVDTMHRSGYLFGIHDQYRDYYHSAASYDEDYACRAADGTIPSHSRWAGGPQSYLCAKLVKQYVKRNFTELKQHGIELDCAYLDVFTCNEGDECINKRHRMTRRDCYEGRAKCFSYLVSEGILPSSEEVSDWSVASLVFCHYAPYDFMMLEPGTPKQGIAVPLFNLVYHDSVIQPWMMDRVLEHEDYMLHALLNGGAPYVIRDPAYPNIDGAFTPGVSLSLDEQIARCEVVARLHEKVGMAELVSYEHVGGAFAPGVGIWKSVFATREGKTIEVVVDFDAQSYEIKE